MIRVNLRMHPETPRISLPGGLTGWQTQFFDGSPGIVLVAKEFSIPDAMRVIPEGMILEFGVAKGHSLKLIAENSYPRKVYGFDWWGGLPHDWNPYDTRGALKCDKPDPPPNGVLIDGLFSDTLEEFLHEHPEPVAFAHIDCDLYCSTAFVLHCLIDRFIAGSIIAFDEIEQWDGERQAWNKYLSKSGQSWELLGKQHAWGEVYRLVDSAHK